MSNFNAVAALSLGFLAALGGFPGSTRAQSNADAVIERVRDKVVSLRVAGTARIDEPPKPPFWGTGVIVPAMPGQTRLRILTARHVVETDDFWSPSASGVDRLVYPIVMGIGGGSQIEPFRGVTVNSAWDIAQVVGPRNVQPAVLASKDMTAAERYFVVSWGKDDNYDGATEEPYVKEVKLAIPPPGDPPVAQGMILLEISTDANARFKESESGSPVFDAQGEVVAIVTQERVNAATGIAKQGLAIPIAAVKRWIDGQVALLEPPTVKIATLALGPRAEFINRLSGTCVFLGKYSARGLSADDDRALSDAPFGTEILHKIIGFFPTQSPDSVSDESAIVVHRLEEPQEFRIPAGGGAVNIRSRCPDVLATPRRTNSNQRTAYYGAPVAKADPTFGLVVQAIERQAYLEDFFYWGEIKSLDQLRTP